MQRLNRSGKRRIRDHSRKILHGQELCEHFNVPQRCIEAFLTAKGLSFHKDSNQQIWASIDVKALAKPLTYDPSHVN